MARSKKRVSGLALELFMVLAVVSAPSYGAWGSSSKTDSMTGKDIHFAYSTSINQVIFKWPYGTVRGHLAVRNHPRYGKDVYFEVDKGHILCHTMDPCSVLIKFDGNNPVSFRGIKPSDGSTTTVFVTGFDKFIKLASKAKKAIVEVEFYQSGRQEFVFDVEGFPIESLKLTEKSRK